MGNRGGDDVQHHMYILIYTLKQKVIYKIVRRIITNVRAPKSRICVPKKKVSASTTVSNVPFVNHTPCRNVLR